MSNVVNICSNVAIDGKALRLGKRRYPLLSILSIDIESVRPATSKLLVGILFAVAAMGFFIRATIDACYLRLDGEFIGLASVSLFLAIGAVKWIRSFTAFPKRYPLMIRLTNGNGRLYFDSGEERDHLLRELRKIRPEIM